MLTTRRSKTKAKRLASVCQRVLTSSCDSDDTQHRGSYTATEGQTYLADASQHQQEIEALDGDLHSAEAGPAAEMRSSNSEQGQVIGLGILDCDALETSHVSVVAKLNPEARDLQHRLEQLERQFGILEEQYAVALKSEQEKVEQLEESLRLMFFEKKRIEQYGPRYSWPTNSSKQRIKAIYKGNFEKLYKRSVKTEIEFLKKEERKLRDVENFPIGPSGSSKVRSRTLRI